MNDSGRSPRGRSPSSDRVAAWLFGLILVLVLVPILGADARLAAEGPGPGTLAGRVDDGSGRGVADARVWIIGGSWSEPSTLAETTTGASGRFAFPGFWEGETGRRARQEFVSVVARDRGGRVGWLTRLRTEKENTSEVTINVVEVADAAGRVVDHLGKPVAGAEVVPILFIRPQTKKRSGSDYARLSPEIARDYAAKTGADGSFVLKGVPRDMEVAANVSAPGFGTPRINWRTDGPVSITLDGRVGRIRGRVIVPADRGERGAIPLSVRRTVADEERKEANPGWFYFKTIAVGDDGTFRFDDLPPGRYQIELGFDADSPYRAEPLKDIEVGPGAEVAGLEVPLRALLTVRGRVVDAEDGRGIAHVAIEAYLDERQSLMHQGRTETDAEGRYEVHVSPGTVLIEPSVAAKDHLPLDHDECPRHVVKADRDWPDLKLPRAGSLSGIAVDAEGKPVDGAEVYLVLPGMNRGFAADGPIRTGPDGTFRVEQIDPEDTLPLRVRTKEAATDGPLVVRPKEQKEPVSVTLDPKHAFRVRGVVKDRAGRPIAGARVALWWNRRYHTEKARYATMGLGSVLETHATDASGRFASNALWPGDSYHVAIGAEGHNAAESSQVEGRAGATHDYGTITLIAAGGHLAGRVVDSTGKPVAGVTVFNRGDAPDAVSTETDDQGKFRLDGLFRRGQVRLRSKRRLPIHGPSLGVRCR